MLFTDLPAAVYHADRDALSCSLLKPLLRSPAHFHLALANGGAATAAKDFGSLVHLLLLEPEKTVSALAVYPGVGTIRACLAIQSSTPTITSATIARISPTVIFSHLGQGMAGSRLARASRASRIRASSS